MSKRPKNTARRESQSREFLEELSQLERLDGDAFRFFCLMMEVAVAMKDARADLPSTLLSEVSARMPWKLDDALASAVRLEVRS